MSLRIAHVYARQNSGMNAVSSTVISVARIILSRRVFQCGEGFIDQSAQFGAAAPRPILHPTIGQKRAEANRAVGHIWRTGKVTTTSAAVNSTPSCRFTSGRSLNSQMVLEARRHSVAADGTSFDLASRTTSRSNICGATGLSGVVPWNSGSIEVGAVTMAEPLC